MEIERGDIYAKELDFLISTSYGPGRYDSNYEEKGLDYPYAYVRWTENRNMTEYLRLIHQHYIDVEKLIDAVFPIEQITEAFESLQQEGKKPIIVLLDYNNPDSYRGCLVIITSSPQLLNDFLSSTLHFARNRYVFNYICVTKKQIQQLTHS